MIKKIWLTFLLLLCCAQASAGHVNKIVFFGDSLTDNGNLSRLLFHFIPKSPPYYDGRFSNGPTWAEYLGDYYYHNKYVDYDIYAYGGSTGIYHAPTSEFIPPSNLKLQIDKYLLDTVFRDKSNTLFVIWIGGNDYLYYRATDPQAVVNNISWAINKLITKGAKQFLILNLPDLARTPQGRVDAGREKLHELTVKNNEKLAESISEFKENFQDVTFFYMDLYKTFEDVMKNPDKYNKKYNLNITDVTEACWQGGYMLRGIPKVSLTKSLQHDLQKNGVTAKPEETKALSEFIMQSPSLTEAYQVGKWYEQGIRPCTNPEEHLFWDRVHPTTLIHKVLAEIIITEIEGKLPIDGKSG